MKKGSMLTALLLAMVMCFSGFAVAESMPVVDDLVLTSDEQANTGTEVTGFTLANYQQQQEAMAMYSAMVATTTLKDFYDQLASAYYADEAVRALFTVEWTNALYAHADELYALEDPADEDAYNLYEEVSALIAWVFGENDSTVYATLSPNGGALSSQTYKLTQDTSISSTLTVAANIDATIDLNGYVLTLTKTDTFAFMISKGGKLTLTDSRSTTTHGTSYGGNKGGIVRTTDTNGNGDRGGAVHVQGSFVMNGGTIYGFKPNVIEDSNEIHQYTYGCGGAVYIQDGATFEMNGGTIDNCSAPGRFGGAVFVDADNGQKGTFTMNGGTIKNCSAVNGGAVYLHVDVRENSTTGAAFTMTGGTISGCIATGKLETTSEKYEYGGGAVYVSAKDKAKATYTMSGGTLSENRAIMRDGSSWKAYGGAVYVTGTFNMTGGTQTGNQVVGTGRQGYGGGVFTYATGTFTMSGDSTITNGLAASGGGVMVWEGSTFTMNGGTISNNECNGTGGFGNGGAVYVQTATFNFNGGQLLNNTAARYGGAVNINQTAIFNLTGSAGDCIVRGNHANYGGGLSQEAGDCQIELSSDKILIENNTAEIDGGGLFIEKGELNISGGTIKNNTAKTGKGGGISIRVNRIAGDVTVNMTGGVCTENTAATHGGGIDIFAYFAGDETNDVVVNLKGGTISKNQANGGGGIHIGINEDNSTAVMYIGENSTGTLLQENKATTYGGAVHIENGSIYMYNGTATGNSANQGGGVAYVSNGNFIMNNGDMNNNSACNGGAVYVTGGDFTISDGAITNNIATAGGGAVYMADGDFHMNYGTVNSNKANNGGAVYMAGSNAVFTMKSGYMNSNEAKALSSGTGDLGGDGGAVYATSGTLYIGEENCPGGNDTSKHDANRSHPEIRLNSADDCGGGIAISDEGKVYFYCGSAKDNTALYKGVGLNVFMDGGYFYLYDGAELGAPRDPYLVIIGGELNNMCETKTMLNLYYYQQQSDKEPYLKGLAEKDEIIDLPDGEYFMTKPSTDVSFFGWTAKGGSTLFVRNKNDYLPSGTAITIVDEEVASSAQNTWDETADNTIKLYALWAPSESKITYVDGMEYKVVTPYEPSKYSLQRADEYFTEIPAIPKAGYAVVGWYIYQDEGKNANWGYEPVYTSSTKSYETLDYAALKANGQYLPLDKPGATLKLNTGTLLFGDITMIAIFEPQFASMQITKLPATAEGNFIFHITGEPLDEELADVDMYVTAQAGTDNAVLITELPVGSYTVTEQSDWSWRYGTVTSVSPDNANGTASVNVTIDNPEAVEQVTFTNTKTENLWLDDEDAVHNVLGTLAPVTTGTPADN